MRGDSEIRVQGNYFEWHTDKRTGPSRQKRRDKMYLSREAVEKQCKFRRFLHEELESSKTETEKAVVMFLLGITQMEIDRIARSLETQQKLSKRHWNHNKHGSGGNFQNRPDVNSGIAVDVGFH